MVHSIGASTAKTVSQWSGLCRAVPLLPDPLSVKAARQVYTRPQTLLAAYCKMSHAWTCWRVPHILVPPPSLCVSVTPHPPTLSLSLCVPPPSPSLSLCNPPPPLPVSLSVSVSLSLFPPPPPRSQSLFRHLYNLLSLSLSLTLSLSLSLSSLSSFPLQLLFIK